MSGLELCCAPVPRESTQPSTLVGAREVAEEGGCGYNPLRRLIHKLHQNPKQSVSSEHRGRFQPKGSVPKPRAAAPAATFL